jgi:hypothetical protein
LPETREEEDAPSIILMTGRREPHGCSSPQSERILDSPVTSEERVKESPRSSKNGTRSEFLAREPGRETEGIKVAA